MQVETRAHRGVPVGAIVDRVLELPLGHWPLVLYRT